MKTYPLLLLLLWLPMFAAGGGCDAQTKRKPEFTVLIWAHGGTRLASYGEIPHHRFSSLFLREYRINGEEFDAPDHAALIGVLIAHDDSKVVTVPIKTWDTGKDGAAFLCKMDKTPGSPPAFSAYSSSEKDLLVQIEGRLCRGTIPGDK
jgi:hypothetical protein